MLDLEKCKLMLDWATREHRDEWNNDPSNGSGHISAFLLKHGPALIAEVERLRDASKPSGDRVPIKVELSFLSWDHRDGNDFNFNDCSWGELHCGTCFNGEIELLEEDIENMREAEANGGTACFLVSLNDSVARVRRLRDEWD